MPLDIDSVRIKLAELEKSLHDSIPGFAGILQVIHKEMQAQPELVYKLKDEEIAVLISGLEKFHGVQVTAPKAEKAAKKGISKAQGLLLSEDDV